MRDRLGRRPARADFYQFRFAQHPGRQPFDFRRQRRGKEQRLPVGGNLFHDPADIGQKTHVEHAIDFIEHEDLHVAEIERALLQQIEQATGSGRDDVHPASGFFALFAVADPAVHDGNAQVGEAAVIAKSGFDLGGQLTRRLEDETAEIPVLREQREDGKREGRRLAGAGLRGADQIFAGENNREGAKLDWRRLGKAHRLGAAHDFRRQAKIFK